MEGGEGMSGREAVSTVLQGVCCVASFFACVRVAALVVVGL